MIRIPQVRVIDEEGTQLGVMPTPKALQLAQERGFDLVEVAPCAIFPQRPVQVVVLCRVMHGKLLEPR